MTLLDQGKGELLKGRVLAGIGYVYEQLGETEKALAYHAQAIAIFQKLGNRWGEAEVQMDAGREHFSLGDLQQALSSYTRAFALFRQLEMPRYQAQTLRDMGLLYAASGMNAKALDAYNNSLALTAPGQDQRYRAYTLNYIGEVYAGTGRQKQAEANFKEALDLNRKATDPSGEAITLYNLARLKRDTGMLAEARDYSETAIKIVESLRTKVAGQDLRASFRASVQRQYELWIDILMRQHEREPQRRFDLAALEASERGRARSLLESLAEERADIRQGVDQTLLNRERALQAKLDAKAQEQLTLSAQVHRKEDTQKLEQELSTITSDYEEVQSEIRARSPRYAALTQPSTLTAAQIQQQLDNDSLLLEFLLGEDRSYVWVVSPSSVQSYVLPPRRVIEDSCRRFYEALTARNRTPDQKNFDADDAESEKFAGTLSQMLFGQLTGLGKKRLVIVADGALQYVPFEALLEPSGGARQPLIENHEIVHLPSASVLAEQRAEFSTRPLAPKAVAVLADPVFERSDPRVSQRSPGKVKQILAAAPESLSPRALREVGLGEGISRLPFSRREAQAIVALAPPGEAFEALDFRANRSVATSHELSQYRVIHIATHGLLNSEHPQLSGILLSLVNREGKPEDGFLQLHEIYNLNLPAELVVLSACQTALGKDVKGEGLVGLTRGFMYAGARRVIASLWKVDDSATAELMTLFYKEMFTNKLSPAAALRAAQVELRKQNHRRAAHFWAGFVIQGEWR